MSLRARLLAAIFVALLISFSLGAGLAAWHAAHTTRVELKAAVVDARRSAAAALANLPRDPGAAAAALSRVVGAFDGSRHVRVVLLGADGAARLANQTAAGRVPPGWFLRMVSPVLAPEQIPVSGVPGVAALQVSANPTSEVAERWVELRERLASFAIFFVVAGLLCSLIAARSLRPLTSLAQGLARVGRGETEAAVAETGPPEIAALGRTFNHMAAALQQAEAQNRRLAQQVLTIAEEERAEIARDLHDEIGPLLFAITTFTAAIGRQVENGDLAPVPAQLQSIQDATAALQREVRGMLERLHDKAPAPADLAGALRDLVAFWRSVRPETTIVLRLALDGCALSGAARECLFRAAQEGISNAVRHGRPSRVEIRADVEDGAAVLAVHDDGAGGPEGVGLGLPGMRARAMALGGSVAVARGPGWTLTVRLPLPQAVAA
jgi:two-component system sensor histidine kinase UhpB